MNKHEIIYYHDIKGYNYLKPTQALINRAQKELMKEYKKFVKNKEKGTRELYYRHSTIRNKRVILYEFVLHMENNRTYKPETSKFEFVASFDFYMKKGLITEKKVYYTIAGGLTSHIITIWFILLNGKKAKEDFLTPKSFK